MNNFEVLILAGGFGTRMSKDFPNTPKPLVPVCGSPILEYQIKECKKYGFKDILILLHFNASKIIDYIGDGSKYGLNISYRIESEPLGTGGAAVQVIELMAKTFLVLYADIYMNINIKKFKDFHKLNNSDVSIVVHPNSHPHDSDLVIVDKFNKVRDFKTHPHRKEELLNNLVNAAMYFFEKKALANLDQTSKKYDIAQDLFPMLLEMKTSIFAYSTVEYLKDMGTPERLKSVENDIKNGIVEARSDTNERSSIFIDRDGTINKEKGFIDSVSKLELIPGSSEAILNINKSKYLAICITNQPVIARGECDLEELDNIHKKLDTLLGRDGAYLDSLYFCPHHPDAGFKGEIKEFKKICKCRKPNTGMILKSKSKFNIRIEDSWMIGDRTGDIELADRLDLFSVLVLSGNGGNDLKYNVRPDFIANDLKHAVNFILKNFDSKRIVFENIVDSLDKKRFIAIGGLSRTGKTSFASIFMKILRQKRTNSHIVELDSFLNLDRSDDQKFYKRYDLKKAIKLIERFKKNEDFIYEDLGYNHKNNHTINYKEASFKKDDLVIIDGTLSFMIAKDLNLPCLKIFMELDEETRFRFFLDKYKKLGKFSNNNDVENLWKHRADNEDQYINMQRGDSNFIFNWID